MDPEYFDNLQPTVTYSPGSQRVFNFKIPVKELERIGMSMAEAQERLEELVLRFEERIEAKPDHFWTPGGIEGWCLRCNPTTRAHVNESMHPPVIQEEVEIDWIERLAA